MARATNLLTPLAYSVAEAMQVSSLGRTKLYELISLGSIETIKVGRRTLIKAASLHKLVESGT